MLHRKIRYEQAKNVLCFLNIFKHLLYNFASVTNAAYIVL